MRSGSHEQCASLTSPKPETLHLRTGQSFLERMGVLYADKIRLNIVAELYMREMSPKQFFEQVGGSSYDSVRRHFLKLVEYGWLRFVRTESSGPGRPEQLFRSTELAVIDDETWAQIPISIRDSFTVQNLLEMGERLATSLTAATFGSKSDGAISFFPLDLDEKGRVQAIAALNGCFRSLSQEQTDAKVRLERSGGPPIRMIVELGGFEIPRADEGRPSWGLPAVSPTEGVPPWPRRISKLFSDPLNLQIMRRLNDRRMSPTELQSALGGLSVEGYDRKCKMLVKLGWVTKVDEQTGGARRGSTENFYRATSPAASPRGLFGDVPDGIKRTEAWRVFNEFCQSALSAVQAGTFNRRPDRHMTLCKLLVDEMGWRQVIALLKNCHRSLAGIGEEAKHRLEIEKTNSERQVVGCFVAGFAAPMSGRHSRL
jgi:hypothetical protein